MAGVMGQRTQSKIFFETEEAGMMVVRSTIPTCVNQRDALIESTMYVPLKSLFHKLSPFKFLELITCLAFGASV